MEWYAKILYNLRGCLGGGRPVKKKYKLKLYYQNNSTNT